MMAKNPLLHRYRGDTAYQKKHKELLWIRKLDIYSIIA